MYIVRFIRKDGKPAEEYYYYNYEDALSHILLFVDDDSNLYKDIIIVKDKFQLRY